MKIALRSGSSSGVEQRSADRLHERTPGGQRPHAHRVLDGHLRELDVAHDGVRASQSMTVGASMRPSTSSGTSGGTVLTKT